MRTKVTFTDYKLGIAGIIIQFIADDNIGLQVADIHRRFIVSGGQPDCLLRVHYGPLPAIELEEKLFESGAVWALYRSSGKYAITFISDVLGPAPYQIAVIDREFKSGDLYIRPITPSGEAEKTAPVSPVSIHSVIPAAYPLDEVFMVNLLARGRGAEFHACGVNYRGTGMIFTGTSGTGKSTISRLWKSNPDALVLSDERIIVRRIDNGFRMYGTPWQSNAAASSPENVPLERTFFIKHSPENHAVLLKAGDAASRLFTRCFPTFWDESSLNYTLDLVGQIAEQVPCYELGFVPDNNVLDFVNKINSPEISR